MGVPALTGIASVWEQARVGAVPLKIIILGQKLSRIETSANPQEAK
jgi:hypothetical protein